MLLIAGLARANVRYWLGSDIPMLVFDFRFALNCGHSAVGAGHW